MQFPIARAHTDVEAAALMRDKAVALFDAGEPCGPEASMAKRLAAAAASEVANACIDCHGGRGYAEEYDVERKLRECRLYETAPITTTSCSRTPASTCSGCPLVLIEARAAPPAALTSAAGRRAASGTRRVTGRVTHHRA